MDKTLNILDEIGFLIKQFRDIYEDEGYLYGEEITTVRRKLAYAVEDALDGKLISPQMAQEYQEVLQDIWEHNLAGYEDTSERIDRLKEICDRQTNRCTEYDKKTNKAFDLSHSLSLVGLGDKVENSKSILQHVKQLMTSYEQLYTKDGALAAEDALCAVGEAIQQGVADKKIVGNDAEKMMDVLKAIKENAFNDNAHQDKIQEFGVVVDFVLSDVKEDKKEKQTEIKDKEDKEEEKKQEPKEQENQTDNRFNLFNFGKKKNQEPKKEEQKPEEQKQEPEKPKTEEEKTEEEKKERKKPDQKEEVNLADVKNANAGQNKEDKNLVDDESKKIALLVNEYEKAYKEAGSVLDDKVVKVWKELTEAIRDASSKNLIPKELEQKLKEGHEFLRTNLLKYDRQIEGISKLKESLGIGSVENLKQETQEQKIVNQDDRFNFNMGQKKEEVKTPERKIGPQDWLKGIKNLEKKREEHQAEHVTESKFREGIENVNNKGNQERKKTEMLKFLLNGKQIQNE